MTPAQVAAEAAARAADAVAEARAAGVVVGARAAVVTPAQVAAEAAARAAEVVAAARFHKLKKIGMARLVNTLKRWAVDPRNLWG